jgi:hypothetical protein
MPTAPRSHAGILAELGGWVLARRHYRMYKRVGGYNKDKWRPKDSDHFIFDLWTPLYAHRPSFNEMMRLFAEMGMEYKLIDPKKYFVR